MRTVHLLRKYDPDEWGGTETAIQRLFEGLKRRHVDCVAYCPKLPRRSHTADPLGSTGCRVKRFRACVPVWGLSKAERRQQVAVGGNLMSFDLMPSLWRERGVGVVHTHALGRIGAMGRMFAKWRNIPLVATIHGGVLDLPASITRGYQEPRQHGWEWGKIFGALLRARRLLLDADAIVTCNPREAELWRQRHPEKLVQVQPHGVPMEMYRTPHRVAAREAFPEIVGKDVLLAVGRIDNVKNQAWLVEQMPVVFARHPRAMLVLAGSVTDAACGEKIRARIRELGLEHRILLTGGLPPGDPRLIGLFQEAALVLLPSISETFGLVLLEAWAAGTSVLSSRTSGAKALIKPGENGWLFELEAPESFHELLDRSLADPELRMQMAAAGGHLVAAEYNTDVLAGRMKSLYERLMEEKHALRNSA